MTKFGTALALEVTRILVGRQFHDTFSCPLAPPSLDCRRSIQHDRGTLLDGASSRLPMNEPPIDPNQLSALLGISAEDAAKLVQAAEDEIRQRSAEVLARDPDAGRISDTERAALQAQAESTGVPLEQLLEHLVRGRAFASDVLAELCLHGPKISPEDVAACFDSELPNGWDDMIPKELLDDHGRTCNKPPPPK
jgi:hypothetical protein